MGETRRQFAEAAEQFVDIKRDGAAWTVFDDYKRVERGGAWFIEARGKGRTYRPLYDEPGIFAYLANIGEEFGAPDDMDGAKTLALKFAQRYGVLGLSPHPEPTRKPGGGLLLPASDDPGDLLDAYGQGDRRRDSIDAFGREAWTAAQAWKFYQAAMDGDLAALMGETVRLPSGKATIKRPDVFDMFRPTDVPRNASDAGEALLVGMNAAAEIAQGRVAAWCAPAIYRRNGRLERGWGFKNLAGAAWLQFFLLLTADKGDQQCENPDCPDLNPVIIREPGTTGPRQRYCNDKCRTHAHYINKTKPRRRASR
jgi:hypothetical protein